MPEQHPHDHGHLRSIVSTLEVVPSHSKYKPKIHLETLTGRTADIMLMLTYFMFFACVAINIIFRSVGYINYNEIKTGLCQNCSNSSQTYTLNITDVSKQDILSFKIQVTQNNFTSLVGWTQGSHLKVCSPVTLQYDAKVWICLNSNGCHSFSSISAITTSQISSSSWVLFDVEQGKTLTTNMCRLRLERSITVNLISSSFNIHVSVTCHNLFLLYNIKQFNHLSSYCFCFLYK